MADDQRHSLVILTDNQHETPMQGPQWKPPPVPPIPEDAAWKRRSLKRDSYTSASFNLQSAYESRKSLVTPTAETRPSWAEAPRPQSTYFPVAERMRLLRRPSIESRTVSWDHHPANPRHWSSLIRWLHAFAILLTTFTTSLASSINAPSHARYADDYNISKIASVLPYSLFLLGLSFAPLTACLRQFTGRKTLTIIITALLAVFTLISAFVKNFTAIVVARFLAGVVVSTYSACAPAALLDLFAAGQRSLVFILYGVSITVGTVLGSFIGSVVQNRLSLEWPQYILLICIAAAGAPCILIRETSQELLASHRTTQSTRTSAHNLASFLNRQIRIVARQRCVLLAVIPFASISAVAFTLLQMLPRTFQETYGFDSMGQGCILLSSLCGCAVGILILTMHHLFVYGPKRMEWEQDFIKAWEKYDRQKSRPSSRHQRKASLKSATSTTRSDSAMSPAVQSQEKLPQSYMSPGFAVALATEVNSLPSTQGKFVSAEKIWKISNKHSTIEDTLCELEARYYVQLDRAKTTEMYEYWSKPGKRTSVVLTSPPVPQPMQIATTEGSDEHRASTLAALERQDTLSISGTSASVRQPGRSLFFDAPLLARQRPPPEWRLDPALAGAVLSTAGLFILAWTQSQSIPWIVPAVGLGIFGCGAFLVGVCVCLYLTDRFGTADIVHAMTIISGISYAVAFVFAMVSLPLFDGIGPGWAVSVLGFCSLGLWVGPMGLKYADHADISLPRN